MKEAETKVLTPMEQFQLSREELYSKKHLNRRICKLLTDRLDATAPEDKEITSLYDTLFEWLTMDFYASKDATMTVLLSKLKPDDVITALLTTILPCYEWATIQKVAVPIAKQLNLITILGDEKLAVQRACELVIFMSKATTLYTVHIEDDDLVVNGIEVISNVELGEEIHTAIANTLFLPPMVIPPRKRVKNSDSCFMIVDRPAISDPMAQHSMKLNLEALHAAGQVPYRVDIEAYNHPEKLKAYEPTPEKPALTPKEAMARNMEFQQRTELSKVVAKDLHDRDVPFYLPWYFDTRGRMYSAGYHLNIQSNDFGKSCIVLANAQYCEGDLFHTKEVPEIVPMLDDGLEYFPCPQCGRDAAMDYCDAHGEYYECERHNTPYRFTVK